MKLYSSAHNKKNGFTLIELLVTISIISIIVVVGTGSFISSQRTARANKIVSDLKAWQNSLEAYAADNGSNYPNPSCDPGATYLPAGIPKGPLTDNVYTPASCTASSYCICVNLNAENANISSIANSNSACNYQAASKNFSCISNLQ